MHYADINECASNPCLHGTCQDLVDEFFCNCTAGYTGYNCSEGTESNAFECLVYHSTIISIHSPYSFLICRG